MKTNYEMYCVDVETLGLEYLKHEIIELSAYRFSDESQKTWWLKPSNPETAEPEALRINGHKMEDLKHQTKFGVDRYKDPKEVIAEIENWMLQDMMAAKDRILVGQNCIFDLNFMEALWKKHATIETFPFGNRPLLLDTKQIALFLDIINGGKKNEFYNLKSLVERYGVKKEKAHLAACDVRMTRDVLFAEMKLVEKLIG